MKCATLIFDGCETYMSKRLEKGQKTVGKVNKPAIAKKRSGKKRWQVKCMGRYPFSAHMNKYLKVMENYWAETTYIERRKKLKFLGKTFRELKQGGLISTTNPSKIREKDINNFIGWMKDKKIKKTVNGKTIVNIGYDPQTKGKLLNVLNQFLRWCDNPIIDKMKIKHKDLMDWYSDVEICSLNKEDVYLIHEASKHIEGWNGVVAEFITAFYPATGLRPKELRLANVQDVDLIKWRFKVTRPKGENKYGRKRTVNIPPQIRPIVIKYLRDREIYLIENKLPELNPLIPSIKNKDNDYYYTGHAIRRIKRKIEQTIKEVYGVEIYFKIKDFRPTYGQTLKDNNVNIETISKMLGHNSTITTEKFYARMRDEKALEEMDEAFEHIDLGIKV